MFSAPRHWLLIGCAAVAVAVNPIRQAIAQKYDLSALDRVRAAATMIPVKRPIEVRFQEFFEFAAPLSQFVEGADDEPARWIYGVFQLRFNDGWIMVDSGADKEFTGSTGFSDTGYKEITEALAKANLNVLTHEHSDHALGLVHGATSSLAASKTILTVEQRDAMLAVKQGLPIPTISTEESRYFHVVDYEDILPIAPGVVLIKAPGHSPGSQMVFVSLEGEVEILIIGDIVWHQMQIDEGLQKGPASKSLNEDRERLKSQIEWLQAVAKTGVNLAIAHDKSGLEAQIDRGILERGLRLAP